MLHDVAAYRAANVRLIDAFGGNAHSEIHRLSIETSSSLNFDTAIDHQGLNFLTLMLNGLTLTINKQYIEALEVFQKVDENCVPTKMRTAIRVDRAWCLSNIGENDQAWAEAEHALHDIHHTEEDDEVAYAYSRISQVAANCGHKECAKKYFQSAEIALQKHREFQEILLEKLAALK